MKKWVSNGLAVLLLSSSLSAGTVAYADSDPQLPSTTEIHNVQNAPTKAPEFKDIANHWAKDAVDRWSSRGVVNGSSANKFEPNKQITRSEWVSLLNRTFQFQTNAEVIFADVNSNKWYTQDVKTAAASGYIKGFEDGTFKPEAPITREEAAVTLASILKLSQGAGQAPTFKDQSQIAGWSQDQVAEVVQKGIMKGYSDQTFQPNKSLTRAEAVSVLDRAADVFGAWYGEAGTFGPKYGIQEEKGSVIINKTGATLQNTDIAGDLIIGKGVGQGDVYLQNVTVHGNTYVYGGGEHSVHLDNVTMVKVIVNKKDGTVRLVAEGNSSIQEVTVNTGANLDVSKGVSVNKVTLTNELPEQSTVRLNGYFNTVNVEAFSIALHIPEGSIDNLNISDTATGTTVDTGKEASILSLVLNAAAKVIGLGSIDKATINSKDVSFEQAPKNVSLGDKVPSDLKINIGNKDVEVGNINPPAAATAPSTGSTSVSSDSGSISGSNSGSTNSGNYSGNQGNTDGGLLGPVSIESDVVTVGEAVYFTSPSNGIAYFASQQIPPDLNTLNLAVQSGEVLKKEVKAGERNFFLTSELNIQYPENDFRISLYEINSNSNYYYNSSVISVTDERSPLTQNPINMEYGTEPEYFALKYNRKIELVPGKSTGDIVQVVLENGSVEPFTNALGTVEIDGTKVYIKPTDPSQLGKNFKFRVQADSIQTVTNNQEQNVEYTTGPMNLLVKIELVSPATSNQAKVKIGDLIEFKVADGTTVYLVPEYVSGSQQTFDDIVTDGWGKKVDVLSAQANQTVSIPTDNLAPGKYYLLAWGGHAIYNIELVQ